MWYDRFQKVGKYVCLTCPVQMCLSPFLRSKQHRINHRRHQNRVVSPRRLYNLVFQGDEAWWKHEIIGDPGRGAGSDLMVYHRIQWYAIGSEDWIR